MPIVNDDDEIFDILFAFIAQSDDEEKEEE